MIPPQVATGVPASELQDVIDGYHRQKPPPVSVTSSSDGPGTFTVIAVLPADAANAPNQSGPSPSDGQKPHDPSTGGAGTPAAIMSNNAVVNPPPTGFMADIATFFQWILNHIIAILGAIVLVLVVIGAVWFALPNGNVVSSPALDDFEQALDEAIQQNMKNFVWWYKANIVIQSTLILTALFATVAASITTKDNADTLKKYTVFLTAVTVALASVQSTFHIRDNVNSFITASGRLELLESEYLVARAPFEAQLRASAGKPPGEKIVPLELLKIQQSSLKKYVDIEADRMRAWASIGQQTSPQSPPAPVPETPGPAPSPKP